VCGIRVAEKSADGSRIFGNIPGFNKGIYRTYPWPYANSAFKAEFFMYIYFIFFRIDLYGFRWAIG
jgi:hypothetical protein